MTAPPVEGAANQALLDVLSAFLEVPRSRLTLVAGSRGRTKRVCILGLRAAEVRARIEKQLPFSA